MINQLPRCDFAATSKSADALSRSEVYLKYLAGRSEVKGTTRIHSSKRLPRELDDCTKTEILTDPDLDVKVTHDLLGSCVL